jgi:hypothetical protein
MSRLPQVCRTEQTAFSAHYDLASGPGVQFFEVVGFQAQSHARSLRQALISLLDQYPEASDAAVDAARSAVVAVEGMYRGTLASLTTTR